MAHGDYARNYMEDFARVTGLQPVSETPRRYLWTDAFAVCNYLELFRAGGDEKYRNLALRLVDQVHHTLGRHRGDDPRSGWISGLSEEEGEMHPTIGGLRIGKTLPERGTDEQYDDVREWDQDGQYYHYLTKWVHALNRVSRVTGDPKFLRWAIELGHVAHAAFTYLPRGNERKRMYWKMSIDLSRPLVPSMGQHDPLDGFVTYAELLLTATQDFGHPGQPGLVEDIADMRAICQGLEMTTTDPLGIGGLLSDASRLIQIAGRGGQVPAGLIVTILEGARRGLDAYTRSGSLDLPARHRLAFRELGLSIGLAAAETMPVWIENTPSLTNREVVLGRVNVILHYLPLREHIERFWLVPANQEPASWTDHRDINRVMLATSLAPEGFLGI